MRNGDITSLIVYFGIIITVCIFIVVLEKINKKLNIYFIEIMTETLKEEKTMHTTWILAIIMAIMLFNKNFMGFWYLLICSIVLLYLRMNEIAIIKDGEEPKQVNYNLFFIFMAIGLVFIGFSNA